MGVVLTGPDMSVRGMKKAFKTGIDEAFTHHHKVFLPKHFKKTSPARYGAQGPYKNAQQYGRRKGKKKRSGGSRNRTPDKISLSVEDTLRQIPLVHTGRSKDRILGGPIKLIGPLETRRMLIGAPNHFFYKMPGTIEKKEAVEFVLKEESDVFVDIVDKNVQKHLDKKTIRKRG